MCDIILEMHYNRLILAAVVRDFAKLMPNWNRYA
ncbi:hypothetical protein AGR7A_Cc10065 [Agrobacterium deltaense NCPPB 1641]|uniref:Uncharacterized protein n=1 Tax=Agrobacterium deltaense NCPPB 1641 TaxID=1183425 RepID=A0A1S7TID1_9HYPH|nr:hypothetical protein AGR7A_Cc10065 [Agrobacterium deltaense NCPPB 1641]